MPRSHLAERAVTTPTSPSDAMSAGVPMLVATATATLAGVILAGPPGVVAGVLVPATGAAIVDHRSGRLPNRLTALTGAAAAAGTVIVTAIDSPAVLASAFAGLLAFAGPLLVTHLAAPAAIGLGDVKLAVGLGAALGLVDPLLGLVALCLATGVTALGAVLLRRRALPLGPGLVAGTAAAVGAIELGCWT